jgi:diguanylate cyclase (GGDEF)-like protein/PAS domain S-box-containing protein
MHPRASGLSAPPGAHSPSACSTPAVAAGDFSGQQENDRQAKPPVERRRRRPSEHVWHEALESVNRALVLYEKTNGMLLASEKKYRSLFDDAPAGLFRAGFDGQWIMANRSMAVICGYETPEELLTEASATLTRFFVDRAVWSDLLRHLALEPFRQCIEVEWMARGGVRKWVQLSIRAFSEDGRIVMIDGVAEDITERKSSEDRMRLLAYYDPVTGLPNRALLEERLTDALDIARGQNRQVALLLLELGRFKMINDSLGKALGDGLLQESADRIRAAVGEEHTVARVSGAEFAVILGDTRDSSGVERTAQRIVDSLGAEFALFGHSLNVPCTMGIGIYPGDGLDGQTLFERADVAMYSAKEQGINGFRFFSHEMNYQILDRLRIENGLRLALERDELFLVYQPQVDIRTGSIAGVEALLRWQHPQLGLVPPGDFIGVAESSGLIVPIGEWVLRTACLQARKWRDAGLPQVPVAVNVSAIQFRQQGFCELIRCVLRDTGLPPKSLELELTEGLLLTNADVGLTLIQELREMGVKLTIDDFGTGYSSLGYLRQFKVNRLKIDRSFVRDVPGNVDDSAITTAIIEMARALNVDVVAEGVENAQQLDFLRAQRCYEIQGYYFSRPVPVEQMTEQLRGAVIPSA